MTRARATNSSDAVFLDQPCWYTLPAMGPHGEKRADCRAWRRTPEEQSHRGEQRPCLRGRVAC